MAETAAVLADCVLPRVPVRQWVLSFPIPLRILLAAHPELLIPVLRIVHRVIASFLLSQAGLKRTDADAGAVTLIQRFGSTANLNVHLHCLVLDGAYRRTEGELILDAARAPSGAELAGLLDQTVARLINMLTRASHLVEEQGMIYLADTDADHPLSMLQAASCTYRIALGPRAGQKVLSLRTGDSRDEKIARGLCADAPASACTLRCGFGADQRKQLEQLYRYIAHERLSRNAKGQVVLKLKSPYRDGTIHIVMHPQEFMQSLAAVVPRRRLHLIRFHGVLAPNARLRVSDHPATCAEGQRTGTRARPSGADELGRLLKRVFDNYVERCACGGQLKIIAAIEEPVVIVRILTLLGLPARAPPRPRRESFRSTTQPDSLTGAKKRRFYGRIDGRARPAVA